MITEMDRIRMILNDPEKTPMTLAQIVTEEIREFRKSDEFKCMADAERYFRNRSAVQKKSVQIENRSNVKIERPILKKLVDQKINYLLSKPWSVRTENEQYADALNELFDPTFRKKIYNFGKDAVKSGIAWMIPYFADGKLQFMRVPSTQIIPFWADSEHTKIDAFIYFYDQTVYIGTVKHSVLKAEFWWNGGVKHFRTNPTVYTDAVHDYFPVNEFFVDTEYGDESNDYTEPHIIIEQNGKSMPYNWKTPPIIWLKYNDEELPLFYFVKDLIDDINWQNSVTADVLRDVANFIFVLRNYDGTDLSEFMKNLREYMAIKVDENGGVDKLQANIDIDAVMKFLDNERRDLYSYAAAVDTKDPDLGNASGTAIEFRYMDLDADCDALGVELNDAFRRMKYFIDDYFRIMGIGDFENDRFDILFNKDLPVNENDVISNAKNSVGIISQKTILANHPWVQDVDDEMDQIEKEKQAAMESYGTGLFDSTFGSSNAQEAESNGGNVNDA